MKQQARDRHLVWAARDIGDGNAVGQSRDPQIQLLQGAQFGTLLVKGRCR
jgi:hypothetical protein